MARRTEPRAAAWLAALALAAPAASAQTAYVTNQNEGALSVLDLRARQETARHPLSGQPAGVAVDGDAVFTVSPEDKAVRRWDRDGTVTAEAILDGGPIGVAAGGGRVFVSDFYAPRIWILDPGDLAIIGTLATGAPPAGLATGAGWLASADRDGDAVSLFDLATLTRRAVPVGARPFGLGFAPDGTLWVANVGSDDLSVIDPAAGRAVARIPVGTRPYGLAFAQGRAFVSNQYADTVSVIDLARRDAVATLDVGEYPEGIDATADGRLVVVANWFSNTVTLIDPAVPEVTGEIAVGDGPRAFGRFIAE